MVHSTKTIGHGFTRFNMDTNGFKNLFSIRVHPCSSVAKILVSLVLSWFFGFSGVVSAGELNFRPLSLVPIQEGGRYKPFDTFARESSRMVTGRESYEGRLPVATI